MSVVDEEWTSVLAAERNEVTHKLRYAWGLNLTMFDVRALHRRKRELDVLFRRHYKKEAKKQAKEREASNGNTEQDNRDNVVRGPWKG